MTGDGSPGSGVGPDAVETSESHPGLDGSASDGTPDFRAARQHVLTELLRFVADLRNHGVDVPATGALDAARALATVGLRDEQRVSAALRATLLSETDDADAFDEAFPTFWHRLRSGIDRIATADDGSDPDRTGEDDSRPDSSTDADADGEEPGTLPDAEPPSMDSDEEGNVDVRIPTERRHASGSRGVESTGSDARRYSAVGGSQPVDADRPDLSSRELAAIDRFVDSLAALPGRRRRRSTAGQVMDARGALRASLETGGVPIDLPRTEATPSELRCCLLLDVSGSVLDTVDRSALLAFAERLVATARDARVFLFDTEVAEATSAFERANGDPAEALRSASLEWGGGTRIGHAIDVIRRDSPHAVDRRTVVLVLSDGLDVGDPDLLTDGITWLANRASEIVWLNPLAVSPAFEPTSRGMATVEPYLDALFGFAEAMDLAEAGRQIERHGLHGPVGYEHDSRHRRSATDGGVRE